MTTSDIQGDINDDKHGISRRDLMLAEGGLGLTAAAAAMGAGAATAAGGNDGVKRIQPSPGYVKMTFRPVLPIAVFSGGFPGVSWYRWNYGMNG